MKSIIVFTITVLVVQSTADSAFAPFYRYFRGAGTDHFYTTNIAEINTAVPGQTGNHGYTSEGIECILRTTPTSTTVPLYRYWKHSVTDHFYTTDPEEIGTTTNGATGKYDYVSEGIAGYCHPTQVADSVPLYRYWQSTGSDHFYTTNPKEIGTVTPGQVGNYGYISDGITCYVFEYAN